MNGLIDCSIADLSFFCFHNKIEILYLELIFSINCKGATQVSGPTSPCTYLRVNIENILNPMYMAVGL